VRKTVRRVLLLTAALTAAAALAGGAGSNVGRDTFAGVWVGVEAPVGDGSTDVMAISGPGSDGSRKWLYYETNASGYCGGGPLTAEGTAQAAGSVLTVTVALTHCLNGSSGSFPPPFGITMAATGDGHIDWSGVIFSRVGQP
jgi:hypothetical protein